jgi:hypothetical protein
MRASCRRSRLRVLFPVLRTGDGVTRLRICQHLFMAWLVSSSLVCVVFIAGFIRSLYSNDWIEYQSETPHISSRWQFFSGSGGLLFVRRERYVDHQVWDGSDAASRFNGGGGWSARSERPEGRHGFHRFPSWRTATYADRSYTASSWEIRMSWLVPILLVAATPAWHLIRRRRQKLERWRRQGKCPNCGYDLRASFDRCPECGRRKPGPLFVPSDEALSRLGGGEQVQR